MTLCTLARNTDLEGYVFDHLFTHLFTCFFIIHGPFYPFEKLPFVHNTHHFLWASGFEGYEHYETQTRKKKKRIDKKNHITTIS